MRLFGIGVLLLSLVALATPAHAVTLGFDCITFNNLGDCSLGEAQLEVEVTDIGGGEVRFHFRNLDPPGEQLTIAEIYFDDGSLLSLTMIDDSLPGVDFTQSASPPNLPGGGTLVPPFVVTDMFFAEPVAPPAENGVDPGEWLGIIFELQGGQTFADVLDELANGDLRIGIRVINFSSEGSDSFVNRPPDGMLPEPQAAALVLLGLAGLLLRRWRS